MRGAEGPYNAAPVEWRRSRWTRLPQTLANLLSLAARGRGAKQGDGVFDHFSPAANFQFDGDPLRLERNATLPTVSFSIPAPSHGTTHLLK